MPNRAKDWLMQADERHEWACFTAQQSAKKAVKALHMALGQERGGV